MKKIIIIFIFFVANTNVYCQENQLNGKKYDRIGGYYDFLDGMARAELNGKIGYIDRNGDVVIPLIYDDLELFYNDIARAQFNGKYGFIDRKGNVVIPFEYDGLDTWFFENLARAKMNGKHGFINRKGETVVPFENNRIFVFY